MPGKNTKYKRKFFEVCDNAPIGYQFGVYICAERDMLLHIRDVYLTIALVKWTIRIGVMTDYDNPIIKEEVKG